MGSLGQETHGRSSITFILHNIVYRKEVKNEKESCADE